MCLDPWSKHSSATGGYFECNRYKEITKADDLLRERRNEVRAYLGRHIACFTFHSFLSIQSDRYEKLSYFQHFYSRYSNHQDSLKVMLRACSYDGHEPFQQIVLYWDKTHVIILQKLVRICKHLVVSYQPCLDVLHAM